MGRNVGQIWTWQDQWQQTLPAILRYSEQPGSRQQPLSATPQTPSYMVPPIYWRISHLQLHPDQFPIPIVTQRCACNEGAWLWIQPLPHLCQSTAVITTGKVQVTTTSQIELGMSDRTSAQTKIPNSHIQQILELSDDVDTEEKQLSESILECAAPLCPPICCWIQPRILDECLDLVDKWKWAKHIDLKHYRCLNKEVRQRMKVEREAYWNSVAANLEEESSREKYQTLYLILRSLSGKTKSINDVDQENVRSSGECLLRWK